VPGLDPPWLTASGNLPCFNLRVVCSVTLVGGIDGSASFAMLVSDAGGSVAVGGVT